MTIKSLMKVSSSHRQERNPAGDSSVPSVRVAVGTRYRQATCLTQRTVLGIEGARGEDHSLASPPES